MSVAQKIQVDLHPETGLASPSNSTDLPTHTKDTLKSTPPAHDAIIELADGSIHSGISFGARGQSVAGECVFQTGKP